YLVRISCAEPTADKFWDICQFQLIRDRAHRRGSRLEGPNEFNRCVVINRIGLEGVHESSTPYNIGQCDRGCRWCYSGAFRCASAPCALEKRFLLPDQCTGTCPSVPSPNQPCCMVGSTKPYAIFWAQAAGCLCPNLGCAQLL